MENVIGFTLPLSLGAVNFYCDILFFFQKGEYEILNFLDSEGKTFPINEEIEWYFNVKFKPDMLSILNQRFQETLCEMYTKYSASCNKGITDYQ